MQIKQKACSGLLLRAKMPMARGREAGLTPGSASSHELPANAHLGGCRGCLKYLVPAVHMGDRD